jgi:phosphoribosylformylglycinamidine (FGAM) synthase PurS component
MTEPITAVTIAALAFNEFIKAGAGELAKKSISGGVEGVKKLRDYLKSKFVGNERATDAIAELEQHGTEAALTKVTKYLDLEMVEDEAFAHDVRQLAQQIINNQTVENRQYNNYGRDQINIENITGDPKIGGS